VKRYRNSRTPAVVAATTSTPVWVPFTLWLLAAALSILRCREMRTVLLAPLQLGAGRDVSGEPGGALRSACLVPGVLQR
jgi:hypothetical protein